ncbi:MAG: hypothetical protein JW725_02295 [Candidatus Babeliaceae bacterium]|nr:hypothetical protein [Candidatus Babeliaceae bacterium]
MQLDRGIYQRFEQLKKDLYTLGLLPYFISRIPEFGGWANEVSVFLDCTFGEDLSVCQKFSKSFEDYCLTPNNQLAMKCVAIFNETKKEYESGMLKPKKENSESNTVVNQEVESSPDTKDHQAGSQSPEGGNQESSLIPAFLIFFFLLGALVGIGFLIRESLFIFLQRYLKDVGIFIIYTGFVGVSLIAAVVMFGIMRSTGTLKGKSKQNQYEFAGAMAGFFVLLFFLIITYNRYTPQTVALKINGNVRFIEDGRVVGSVNGAKIALSQFSGFETETDRNGNFELKLPENQAIQVLELQITYKGKTSFHKFERTKLENMEIEIEKGSGEVLEKDSQAMTPLPTTPPGDKVQYKVTLVVPASMDNGNVFVDGNEAKKIPPFRATEITVLVDKKNSNHKFTVTKEGKICEEKAFIQNDATLYFSCSY